LLRWLSTSKLTTSAAALLKVFFDPKERKSCADRNLRNPSCEYELKAIVECKINFLKRLFSFLITIQTYIIQTDRTPSGDYQVPIETCQIYWHF